MREKGTKKSYAQSGQCTRAMPSSSNDEEFSDFTFIVNGVKTEYAVINVDNSKNNSVNKVVYFTKWYCAKVFFPSQKFITIRNTYGCLYGESSFDQTANYLYGTGRNWLGPIEKITIQWTAEPSRWITTGFRSGQKYWQTGQYEYMSELENIEPKESENLSFGVWSAPPWDAPYSSFRSGEIITDGNLQAILKEDSFVLCSVEQLDVFRYILDVVMDKSKQIDSKKYPDYIERFKYLREHISTYGKYPSIPSGIKLIERIISEKKKFK